MMKEEATLVSCHQPCSQCGSSDALSIYSDGHSYCFSCSAYTKGDTVEQKVDKKFLPIEPCVLKARGINKDTCVKYSYGISKDVRTGQTIQVANYYNKDYELLGQKCRTKDKEFYVIGKLYNTFYGQHLFNGGSKVVITEGEIDCLTVAQVTGLKYPVVSLACGAKSARKTFEEQYEWLMLFDEVIVMFDNDKAGQQAVEQVVGILPPNKLKIATLSMKDANEVLLHGEAKEIITAIFSARPYSPSDIINARDMMEEVFVIDDTTKNYPFPLCPSLTEKTQGFRRGELVLMTAGTGVGKSTYARTLAYHMGMEEKIGLMMLEENKLKTIRALLSIKEKRPLHLLWNTLKEEQIEKLKESYKELYGSGNYVLYDHFGSIESNSLLDKLRYMIVVEGCKFIVLDHISIAISGLEDAGGNERKTIDILMTKLRSLIEETQCTIVVICHLKKTTEGSSFEEGGIISLDDLRGSGSLKQIPDTIIAFERNQQGEDSSIKDISKIRLLKCRHTGETGLTDYIKFDRSTHCLVETSYQQENPVDTLSPF